MRGWQLKQGCKKLLIHRGGGPKLLGSNKIDRNREERRKRSEKGEKTEDNKNRNKRSKKDFLIVVLETFSCNIDKGRI